jgi:hypothetical protein
VNTLPGFLCKYIFWFIHVIWIDAIS